MQTTLDELQAFIAVVDTGSLTAAAEALGLTVSATSRTLGRLEDKLRTTLLHRTTRRLQLTEEGSAFLLRARSIIAAMEEAESEMAHRRERPVGRLRVDAASPFMLHVIVPQVAGYHARHPEVALQLSSNDGIVDLIERRTDVAIRIGPLRDSTLHARPLGSSRMRLLASPDYLARRGKPKTVAQLQQHVLLGFTQPEVLNDWPLRHADGSLLHITPTIAASSGETLRQLALAGTGIARLSDFMCAADRADGRLVELLVKDTVDIREPINAVYYRNTAVSTRITSFLDYLVEQLGPTPFTA
ncbi:DNA-binding transcriptional regulator, LysR family [Pseudoxanthomonas sp. GM95]|uniref:LysR family transcriptional regulator n=1 Tax=Pseudoxanthomonas sp. GM95 TaxID=1881043 RepID=UPI0008CE467D|nr:LysR family transcriptional regulator [Pseudoxanthomonas sp. GM95]SEM25708.1 DNA-binding transcriptional regulator, LysR family [Pseudoxanthomonas sp. GM95]